MPRPRFAIQPSEHRAAGATCAIAIDQVRSALLHLYDLPHLQNHPLAAYAQPGGDERPRPATAGRRLQHQLRDAIEQLRPGTASTLSHDWRGYHLLTWRYVDGLTAPAVQAKLALSKSEYYRDHQQALASVASLLQERWGLSRRPGHERLGDTALSALPTSEPGGHTAGERPPIGPRHNLPCALTSFIGRQAELARLAELLETSRLVTLTGTGGVGKTRLAQELAARTLDRFPDGAWLVELAALTDPRLVVRAVASVLGLPGAHGKQAAAVLVAALRSRRALLLLDNCEHLLDACAHLADAVLRGCPDMQVLATSRQALGIAGEVRWRVPSLAAPEREDVAHLVSHDAVRLFVDRAVAVNPAFAITEQNAASVAQVCRHLDGIPLALELAAARLQAMSVGQLAARLDRRFQVLMEGNRAAAPRQQTLLATLYWSHDLLSERERQLFRRLSVFAGGWTLEAAEAVGAGEGIEPSDVLPLLAELVEKSLVVAEEQADGSERYRLLETLREYGQEQLEQRGEADLVAGRHARYFQELAGAMEPHLTSGDRDAALARLGSEQDNLRRALGWCEFAADRGDGRALELGIGLVGDLFWFWYFRGQLQEAFRWGEALLAPRPTSAGVARAEALLSTGQAAWLLGDDRTARGLLEESAMLWRRIGDEQGLARVLIILGMVTEQPEEAWSLLAQGEGAFRGSGDRWALALTLRLQGLRAFHRGDDAIAREKMEEGLALSRALRDRWFVAQTLNHLGDLARRQADYLRATALYEESLALFREQGVKGGIPSLLHNLGHVALARGDAGGAERLFRESLQRFREQGDQRGTAHCFAGLAGVRAAQRRPEPAARLFGAAEALLEASGTDIGRSNQADYDRNLALLRAQMDGCALAQVWKEGLGMSPEEAVAYATSSTNVRYAAAR